MIKHFQLWDSEAKKIVEVHAKKTGKEWMTTCRNPNHHDQKASLYINEEKKVFFCHGCGFKGKLWDPKYQQRKLAPQPANKESKPNIPEFQIKEYVKDLIDEQRIYLKEARGLTHKVIERYQLGYHKKKKRFTIPIFQNNKCVNIRLYDPSNKEFKILPISKGRSVQLYPEDQLENGEILLCEGEWDALCAISNGIPAITSTTGVQTWKKEWTEKFRGKVVNICLDCQDVSRKAAEKRAVELLLYVSKVRLVNLGLKDKEDITDFFVTYDKTRNDLLNLIEKTPEFEKLTPYQTQKEKPSRIKFNPRPYSLEILSNNFLKYDEYKRFWIYDRTMGIWRDKAELILNSDLRKKILGDKDYKRYCVGEIIADLQGLTWIDEIPEEPEPYFIPLKNKIYDLKNNELLDYSPKYFFINKLATNINEENTECPTIDKIFGELVAPEDVITLYEIPAYCLYRGYPYPKIFILYGSGANGKGAYVQILTKLLGKGNISSATSEDLQSNRFASSQLFGKLLNVSGEMDYAILKKTSMLKQCSGKDLINCERKFREPFSFINYAKMMFLTNQVPLTSDKTYAFYRRIFLLEFPNKFILGESADPMIVNKIPEEEFEGLAWRCLEKAKELYNKGFVFKHHEKTEEVTKKYEDLSNPLNKFLEEYTVKNIDGDIAVGEFNERYLSYLKEKGFRVWTDKEINKVMKDKGFRQKPLHTIKDGRDTTYRAWLELGWK